MESITIGEIATLQAEIKLGYMRFDLLMEIDLRLKEMNTMFEKKLKSLSHGTGISLGKNHAKYRALNKRKIIEPKAWVYYYDGSIGIDFN